MELKHTQPAAATRENRDPHPNQLTEAEIQALIGSPQLSPIEREEVLPPMAKIFRTTEKNVDGWLRLDGSDIHNVAAALLANLNRWADSFEIGATPNGGFQKMLNVRLCELSSGKHDRGGRKRDRQGNEIPCLEDFGFTVACAMIPGPRGRIWSYFRICRADEVRHDPDNGRKIPFRPPTKKPVTQAKTARRAPQATSLVPDVPPTSAGPAEQQNLFGSLTTWLDPEMNGRAAR